MLNIILAFASSILAHFAKACFSLSSWNCVQPSCHNAKVYNISISTLAPYSHTTSWSPMTSQQLGTELACVQLVDHSVEISLVTASHSDDASDLYGAARQQVIWYQHFLFHSVTDRVVGWWQFCKYPIEYVGPSQPDSDFASLRSDIWLEITSPKAILLRKSWTLAVLLWSGSMEKRSQCQ